MVAGGLVAGGLIDRGRVCFGGIVVIGGVFIYFEILARSSCVRVRSAEICFDYIFTVNSIINKLINMYSIGI
jgi:hypothetical protein